MIRQGRVTVDGEPARIGQTIDPALERVEIDGIPLPLQPGLVYRLLNKPRGVVTTAADPQGRRTVLDLVPNEPRVFPAGRLDRDSEGLLLLTNDGELANLVMHPRFGVTKTYLARVQGRPRPQDVQRLMEGIDIGDDRPATAADIRIVARHEAETAVEIVMTEGRKREVRRMLDAIGYPVSRLVRIAIGPLQDRRLKPGEWRDLTIEEVRALYAAAGGSSDA
jgi:23S rRNA pseudouridine2605 synthase